MTKQEILARLAELNTATETRSLTDDEFTEVTSLEADLKRANDTEAFRARQAAYVTPTASLQAAVHVGAGKSDSAEYRAAFDAFIRNPRDESLAAEMRAQSVGSPSAGGYTVPDTMLAKITDRRKSFGGVLNVVENYPTDSGEPIRWTTTDDTANVGVIAAEGAAPTSGGADIVFGEKTLGAYTYQSPGAGNLPLRVSHEALQDSSKDLQQLIVDKLTRRLYRAQAIDAVNGTGTTRPFGIATGTKVEAGTFTGAAITYAALNLARHQVHVDYRDGAVWTFNDATLSQIENLVDSTGRPLLNTHNDGINVARSNATLLGYPVVIDNSWATYADNTENAWGAFGNLLAGYIWRPVGGIQLIVNPYTRANERQVEYTLFTRGDGVVQDPHAFRVLVNEEN